MKNNESTLHLTWSRLRKTFHRLIGEWRPFLEPRIASKEMAEDMMAASIPSLSFFLLLGLSGAIATYGLLANSAPAIIGAMIIAPLMTPIMGLSYGVVQFHWGQLARSAITVFLGITLVIAIAFISARFIKINVTGTEMLSRAFPTLLDLGVAMAAGAAGAFSLSRESIRNSIAGVAISVSLVPPLAVAGIGLALGRQAVAGVGLSFHEVGLFSGGNDIAVGAFVLFLTNLAAIIVVAGIVMTVQGYAAWKRGVFGLIAVIAASIILMQPLSEDFEKLRVKSMSLRLVKTLPITHPHTFESTLRLETLRVREENETIVVRGEGFISRDKVEGLESRLKLFQNELEKKVGEPIIIEVEAVPVDILNFRVTSNKNKNQNAQEIPINNER